MIKSILLPLAEGPLSTTAKDYAFWLAKKEGSQIHALAVMDIKAFEIPVLGTPDGFMPSVVSPPLDESQSLLDELAATAKAALDRFAQECESRKIPCSTEIKTGIPADLISRTALAHDIIVMARTGHSRIATNQDRLEALISQVIRSSVRPVLIAGSRIGEGADIHSIVVAYDGSVHAGRALLVAAELGSRPGVNCTLVTVSTSEDLGEETIEAPHAFLCHHGVVPHKRVIVSTKPSEVICSLVAETKADILIMGAYGHGPVREMLFGSNTEKVLAHCSTSVILQS